MNEALIERARTLYPHSDDMQERWIKAQYLLHERQLGVAVPSPRLAESADETFQSPKVRRLRR